MKKLYSGNIGIDYGQFYIDAAFDDEDDLGLDEDYLDPDGAFEGQENGICGASQQSKLFFVTGIQNGAISVDCEYHDSQPELDESYEDIVEVSLVVSDKQLSLCEWGHEATHKLELPKGEYRVRYLIQGMDKDYDDENEDESDEYWEKPVPGQKHLIQIWSGKTAGDVVIKHTSVNARSWHREWGSMKAA